MADSGSLRSDIAQKMSLDRVRYSQVWEDHRLLEEGLRVDPTDDVLSICSGGCNVLALALLGPRSVIALDMNPAQTALLELKLAGISELEHEGFACLLGAIGSSEEREALYWGLRDQLVPSTRSFWDARLDDLRIGVMHTGRLEAYFRVFQREHLSELWSGELMDRLFAEQPLEEQARIFHEEAATPEFRERFRWYFGREKMAEQGRDPAQFEHVEEGDVGRYFYDRFSFACTELPLHSNFYVEYFLTGGYRDLRKGPPYLRPQNFERLQEVADRVHLHLGELEGVLSRHPRGTISKANLSDIFEYMSTELSDAVFTALGEAMRPGGRIAYWNLLVPRQSPDSSRHVLRTLPETSDRLWRLDRSWFYRAFRLEEVVGA